MEHKDTWYVDMINRYGGLMMSKHDTREDAEKENRRAKRQYGCKAFRIYQGTPAITSAAWKEEQNANN